MDIIFSIATFLIFFLIFIGICVLEYYLAKKEDHLVGLIIPIFLIFMSLWLAAFTLVIYILAKMWKRKKGEGISDVDKMTIDDFDG